MGKEGEENEQGRTQQGEEEATLHTVQAGRLVQALLLVEL